MRIREPIRRARYCLCGGYLVVRISAAPRIREGEVWELLVAEFDRIHHGAGHGATTPRQAALARRARTKAA